MPALLERVDIGIIDTAVLGEVSDEKVSGHVRCLEQGDAGEALDRARKVLIALTAVVLCGAASAHVSSAAAGDGSGSDEEVAAEEVGRCAQPHVFVCTCTV